MTRPTLRIGSQLWGTLLAGLHRRTEGRHESGAFLLGAKRGTQTTVSHVVYYDDLDPDAYRSGICVLHADAFSRLWDMCSALGLAVVADVHVHGRGAGQSNSDRTNPMIARRGHLAIILPRMAKPPVRRWSIGIYEYQGEQTWLSVGGCNARNVLMIEEEPQ